MEPTQGIGRLKLKNQIVKWIAPVMVIVAVTSSLMGQAAPKKKPAQTQVVPAQTQVVSGPAKARPDPTNFDTYEDYVEALVNWTIEQRLVTTGKQVILNAAPMPGRYQIVMRTDIRADTFLLDTQTGKTWVHVEWADLKGNPVLWQYIDRMDNHQEYLEWFKRQIPNDK
jgi:hypothetical protein